LRSNETSSCSEIFRYVPNNGWHSLISPADWYAGVRLAIIGGAVFIDVTIPVNRALSGAASTATSLRSQGNSPWHVYNQLSWFYNQVNHEAPWDIKEPEQWIGTIGTTFPGQFNTPIVFRGQMMTPESLGNFTYGYIGGALGIPLFILHAGSSYAAGFPSSGVISQIQIDYHHQTFNFNPLWVDEVHNDWGYITRGFNAHRSR